ncbi:hypothetical protein [Nocardioides cavernaquae]|jgi:hypothetical protein|uniref:Uncharacterized protein n=1 Tax=Nocardioides cavernaquae TaxID=2321396 RepID=A0A3A5H6F8_9ACTN|nr:hypothetical protein [Nocardioides cavernaquae]RJS46269.1 hypothetical protein D4739_08625 [Nocardioides cavernaquae]
MKLPLGIPLSLPSPTTVKLAVQVTVAAVPPVVKHGDLRAVKHLPFVLTHLDDAAVVAGAISDPVGSAIKAPGAAARFGVRTTVGGARLGIRGVTAAPGFVAKAPGRVLRRR